MPITWKNVEGRGVGDAARLLEGAQRSVNAGIGSFQKILTEGKANEDFNQGVRKDNANSAVKDVLSQFNSVEELDAAKQSGALARLMQEAGGPLADKDLMRDGASNRLGALRTSENQTFEFNQNQAKQAAAPIYQRIQAAIADGDDVLRDQLTRDNEKLLADAGLFGDARMAAKTTDRAELEQGRADTRFSREETAIRTQEQVSAAAQQMLATGIPVSEMKIRLQQQFANQEGIDPQVLAQSIGQVEGQHQALLAPSYQDDAATAAAQARAEILAAGQQREADAVLANQNADYPVNEAFSFTDGGNVTLGSVVQKAGDLGFDTSTIKGASSADKVIMASVEKLTKNKKLGNDSTVPFGRLAEMALEREKKPTMWRNNLKAGTFYSHLEDVYNEWLTSEENKVKRDLNQRVNNDATTRAQLAPLEAAAAARTEQLNKLRDSLYGN